MKKSPVWIALAGIVLLAFGAVAEYVSSRPYSERHVVANAGSCRLDATILQRKGLADGAEAGNVVLFHGLAANKVIMTYLARAFAEQNLRVYMPDSPGHGRSAGPFTPEFAEECGMSFVRGLAARGLIRPDRTILAGHSMGAAIALRVAAKFRPAAVVAISPAPMKPANGVSPELLLYHSLPALQPNTLIVVGKWEPFWLRANAEELTATTQDPSVQFVQLPMNSHVSVLFSPTVARLAQEWSARGFATACATEAAAAKSNRIARRIVGIGGNSVDRWTVHSRNHRQTSSGEDQWLNGFFSSCGRWRNSLRFLWL